MSDRIALSKKERFEVLKRDSFTCQYCGQSAPQVTLEVDHIIPVSKGGTNDVMNLITACFDCNSGKSDRELSDDAVINKQKSQLDELNERRLQLEMMAEWRKGLVDLDEKAVDLICDEFQRCSNFNCNNVNARPKILKWVKKYRLPDILDAVQKSCMQYIKDGTQLEGEKAFSMIPRIVNAQNKYDPDMQELFYIRGIMRNQFGYINEPIAIQLLRELKDAGIPIEGIKGIVLSYKGKSWSSFKRDTEAALKHLQ